MKMILLILLSMASVAWAKPGKKAEGKNLSFDSQVVEGEVYRPDYSVVTGEAPGEGWGVLRLRHNFRDHVETDSREKRR